MREGVNCRVAVRRGSRRRVPGRHAGRARSPAPDAGLRSPERSANSERGSRPSRQTLDLAVLRERPAMVCLAAGAGHDALDRIQTVHRGLRAAYSPANARSRARTACWWDRRRGSPNPAPGSHRRDPADTRCSPARPNAAALPHAHCADRRVHTGATAIRESGEARAESARRGSARRRFRTECGSVRHRPLGTAPAVRTALRKRASGAARRAA